VEERRAARVGTVGGLALLTGGTAIGSVTGGAHSILTSVALALLAAGMGHALLDESRRQACRRSAGGWAVEDTVNAVLLGAWATGALTVTALPIAPPAVRAVAGALAMGYALVCVSFVRKRRRTVATGPAAGTVVASPGNQSAA
jgi:hypothetical protein